MGGSSRSSVQKYDPFEIVVNTNIAGDSGVGNFQLKVSLAESYRYYVDWGDGLTSASTTTTSLTHSYSVPGIYNVKVYGRFDSIYNNGTNEADKITDVISWGNIKWKRFNKSFRGCGNLTGMTTDPPILELMGVVSDLNESFMQTDFDQNLGSWDVSKVTSLRWMFLSSSSFNNGGSPSISGWTTSACTNMAGTFQGTPFNQDIGSWDVSNVQFMNSMFNANPNFNNGGSPSISGWTTSACTQMSGMFASSSPFNQPIGSWDVSNVTTMSQMFFVNTSFNQPIGSWDVSNVHFMTEMFYGSSNFDQDIGSWDVSNVTDMYRMFSFASNFNNGGSPSISGWTINSGFTNMTEMFRLALNFDQPIGSWDVSNVTDMYRMFDAALAFNQDIGSWDVSNVNNMYRMFYQATNFNNGGSPSISGWTTSACTIMIGMFYGSSNFDQNIGSWDVNNVQFMGGMFESSNFNNGGSPSISGWTTSACTTMNSMFLSTPFNQDIGSWDVSNVQFMGGMFQQATNFNNGGSPSISGWTTSNLTDTSQMFFGSTNFNQPIGSWDVSNVLDMGGMFRNASNFNQDIGSWNVSGVTDMTEMFLLSGLDNTNYNALLTGWTGWVGTGATKTLQTNVSFHAGTAKYFTGTTAEAARNYLTDPTTGLSWTITDGGGI